MSIPFQHQFPYFSHDANRSAQTQPNAPKRMVYLDNAATTQKHENVLAAMHSYHVDYNANVHRGGYAIAQQATNAFEAARARIATFIGANDAKEVVFTSGTTEAINVIASGLQERMLSGREILIGESEHHANIVPWQALAKRFGMTIKCLPLASNGEFTQDTLNSWCAHITSNTAILAISHVSNVLGNIYPVKVLCAQAAQHRAISIVDGTQAPAHIDIDVQRLNCDFYCISGHKMYAASGIGVLYGKYSQLCALHPSKLGGEMISQVSWQESEYQLPPMRFEGGTPNIAGAISLAKACEFIDAHFTAINEHEKKLYDAILKGLQGISGLSLLGNMQSSTGILSFVVEGVHAHDIASALAHYNIAVRAGHHCAMPLMSALGVDGCVRVSLACYNTLDDIAYFLSSLSQVLGDITDTGEPHNEVHASDCNSQPSDILIRDFSAASDWSAKHRLLLLYSKQLPVLDKTLRNSSSELHGCEASVWLLKHANGQINAYSDSKVVRGLLAVLLIKANERQQSMNASDYHNYLVQLGLPHYFSEGRRDGMARVISALTAY
ncbi:MAG: aminotransferase class V-fold PLP-dependent enzyme [Glaciecola sp.]